jgi:glutathione peroxidase
MLERVTMRRIVAVSLMAYMMMVGSLTGTAKNARAETGAVTGVHDFTVRSIDGADVPLARYKGKVMLIVNVASKCGHTPQYAGLEELYRRYKDRGLAVLGFPANNFLSQEPGTDAEIKAFCSTKYDVTFDMYSKISVKGDDQDPLYAYLTSEAANPATAGGVKWNFTKYLVDKNGRVIAKFGSGTKPLEEEVVKAIEEALE